MYQKNGRNCFEALFLAFGHGIKGVFLCKMSLQATSHGVTGNVGRPALLIPDFKVLFGIVVVYIPELRVDVSLVLLWIGN